jgi:hypothetical protein
MITALLKNRSLSFIELWSKLNKVHLASKSNMKHSTLKLKLNPNFPQYNLTEKEQKKLIKVLKEMALEIGEKFDL